MIRTRDILSLTEFRQNATAHLDRLVESRSALVLTVNGKARGVVLAPDVFDELVDKAGLAESLVSIDRGMEDALVGRSKPPAAVLRDSITKTDNA